MDYERLKKERDDKELYDRLTAPRHYVYHSFREHAKPDGYYEKDTSTFLGCDLLYKVDTVYGTVQMGYSPVRQQSFLFSNIKSSIYDNAASKYKRELRELQMMRSQKGNNENTIFNSRRREDSASLLYKAEHKPWTPDSVRPYLNRGGQGTLRKVLPFLNRREERARLNENAIARRRMAFREQEMASNPVKLAALRAENRSLLQEQEFLNTILTRKDAGQRSFFRRINYAFDIQKHEMFDYYREVRLAASMEREAAAEAEKPNEEDKKP